MTSSRFTRELGGISSRVLQDYLAEAGATVPAKSASGEIICCGAGWWARITALPDAQHGSLRLNRLSLEVSGEPEHVERVRLILDRKLIRIGG